MGEFTWDKKPFNKYSDKVNFELMELRQHVAALEIKFNALLEGTKAESGSGKGEEGESTIGIKDLGPWVKSGNMTEDLVKATYAIKSATIAMRGYLMLLDQAGLSKDQKKMVRDLEYSMMMIMKAAQAIKILMTVELLSRASMGDPTAWLQLGIAGGYIASSLAYGSKTIGGGV